MSVHRTRRAIFVVRLLNTSYEPNLIIPLNQFLLYRSRCFRKIPFHSLKAVLYNCTHEEQRQLKHISEIFSGLRQEQNFEPSFRATSSKASSVSKNFCNWCASKRCSSQATPLHVTEGHSFHPTTATWEQRPTPPQPSLLSGSCTEQ